MKIGPTIQDGKIGEKDREKRFSEFHASWYQLSGWENHVFSRAKRPEWGTKLGWLANWWHSGERRIPAFQATARRWVRDHKPDLAIYTCISLFVFYHSGGVLPCGTASVVTKFDLLLPAIVALEYIYGRFRVVGLFKIAHGFVYWDHPCQLLADTWCFLHNLTPIPPLDLKKTSLQAGHSRGKVGYLSFQYLPLRIHVNDTSGPLRLCKISTNTKLLRQLFRNFS